MDVFTLLDTVDLARSNLYVAGAGRKPLDVVADKGYFSTESLREISSQDHLPLVAEKKGVGSS